MTVQTNTLPFRSLIWANERQIVAAGFDCAPMLVETNDGQDWHLSGSLDVGRKKVSTTASVLSRFKSMDSRGQADQDTDLSTTHQNTIIEVRPYAGSRDNITEFSTCALDGKVAIWQFDPSQLATELAGLKLN